MAQVKGAAYNNGIRTMKILAIMAVAWDERFESRSTDRTPS
jgi:hypothetical protein